MKSIITNRVVTKAVYNIMCIESIRMNNNSIGGVYMSDIILYTMSWAGKYMHKKLCDSELCACINMHTAEPL